MYIVRIEGDSMLPGLPPGAWLLGVPCWLRRLRPGRVVLFPFRGELLVKRLLSFEGDGWFAVGDNPARSTDSRRFGLIPPSSIRAVALCSLRPFRLL